MSILTRFCVYPKLITIVVTLVYPYSQESKYLEVSPTTNALLTYASALHRTLSYPSLTH